MARLWLNSPLAGAQADFSIPVVVTSTSVNATASETLILAANNLRVGGLIANNGNTNLHVQFPSGEAIIAPGDRAELPEGYLGAIDGFWEGTPTPTGAAAVRDFSL